MRARHPLSALALALLCLLTSSGCAARAAGDPIERLERQRDARPGAIGVLRALGVAYYKGGRFADAVRVLAGARALAPRDGVTALYLGMSAEQAGDLALARSAYESYVRHGRTSRVRRQLRSRLAALAHRELQASAREAVAREASLAPTPGPLTTIAVAPLSFNGNDSTLAPLGRGMADLMITDLSRSSRLTVVERDRLDALLDEVSRSASGRMDAATALRSGRLARAGRLVRGSITQLGGGALRADAAVLNAATAQVGDPVNEEFDLDALFDAEKRIVLALFAEMGIRLTAAERAAVEQRPTRSLAAFLAYSRGLTEEDEGRFDHAARSYGEAARLDPGFSAARSSEQRALRISEGSATTVAAIEASLAGTSEGATVAAAVTGQTAGDGGLAWTLAAARDDLIPSLAADATLTAVSAPVRDGAAAATNLDNITDTGQIIVVSPIPIPNLPRLP